MVIAPASTGRDSSKRIVVIKIDQINKGTCSNFIIFGRMFMIVVIKLIAPKIEEIPAMCSEKMVKSIDSFIW